MPARYVTFNCIKKRAGNYFPALFFKATEKGGYKTRPYEFYVFHHGWMGVQTQKNPFFLRTGFYLPHATCHMLLFKTVQLILLYTYDLYQRFFPRKYFHIVWSDLKMHLHELQKMFGFYP